MVGAAAKLVTPNRWSTCQVSVAENPACSRMLRSGRRLGALHCGLGCGQRVLSRGQLAAHVGKLPDCLTASTCRVRHLTIIAGSRPLSRSRHEEHQHCTAVR